jgi:uncharacterized Fe-S cluster-containing protein
MIYGLHSKQTIGEIQLFKNDKCINKQRFKDRYQRKKFIYKWMEQTHNEAKFYFIIKLDNQNK